MSELDRQTMYEMLREVKKVAMEASLTGSLRKGSSILVNVYNNCLTALTEQGDTNVAALLPKLSREANVDEVGAAAALLAKYMAPRLQQEEGSGFSYTPGPPHGHVIRPNVIVNHRDHELGEADD